MFQEATQATAWGSKETDMGQRPEILESWRVLCEECHYSSEEGDL